MTFGLYEEDFHYNNGFRLKHIAFDGYIGLQVDKNLEVKPVLQKNSFEPQHRIYKAGSSGEQNICIEIILSYIDNQIKNGDITSQSLDFGSDFKVNPDGFVLYKKDDSYFNAYLDIDSYSDILSDTCSTKSLNLDYSDVLSDSDSTEEFNNNNNKRKRLSDTDSREDFDGNNIKKRILSKIPINAFTDTSKSPILSKIPANAFTDISHQRRRSI